MKPWLSKIQKQVQRVQRLRLRDHPHFTPETLSIGTIVLGRLKIIGILGQGGFGRTYKAEHLNRFGQEVALKEFAPDRRSIKDLTKAKELFEREAKVLFQVNHPQIPKFIEHLIDRQGEYERFFICQILMRRFMSVIQNWRGKF
jgi:hypothetical protein